MHDESDFRKAYMMRVIPERHTLFWNVSHYSCFSGKTLIMYAFLE
jgi:hypothetical protein